jgi:hypothetical protein
MVSSILGWSEIELPFMCMYIKDVQRDDMAYFRITLNLSKIDDYKYEYDNPMLVKFKTAVRHYESLMRVKMKTQTLQKWKIDLWDAWLEFKQEIASCNASPSQEKTYAEKTAERKMMAFVENIIEQCKLDADEMIGDNNYAEKKSGQMFEAAEVKVAETARLRLQVDELQQEVEKLKELQRKDAEEKQRVIERDNKIIQIKTQFRDLNIEIQTHIQKDNKKITYATATISQCMLRFWEVEETQPKQYMPIKMTAEEAMIAIYDISESAIPDNDWHKSLLPKSIQQGIHDIFVLTRDFCTKYKREIRVAHEADKPRTVEKRLRKQEALDIQKLKEELEELREWKKINAEKFAIEKFDFEVQVMSLNRDVENGKKEIDKLEKELNVTSNLSVVLTQPNIEALRQVVADMSTNTQTLKASVEKYMWSTVKAPERKEIIASMEQIMHYQNSCTWRGGWLWNAETWASAMVLWNSIQGILKTYHKYWKNYHDTRDEFHGFKLLREC